MTPDQILEARQTDWQALSQGNKKVDELCAEIERLQAPKPEPRCPSCKNHLPVCVNRSRGGCWVISCRCCDMGVDGFSTIDAALDAWRPKGGAM